MKPNLRILSEELVHQIIAEGLELLMDPGVKVHNDEELDLLRRRGKEVVRRPYSNAPPTA